MDVRLAHEKEFATSYSSNGISEMEELIVFPRGSSYKNIDFLWHACSTSYDANRTYSFMSGYTRLVVRLTGDQLLLNHNNNSHSHVIKRNKFYEFSGDWATTCEVESTVTDFLVTYKTGEVAVSANIFESKEDEVVVSLSSHGTSTLLYNTQGETATVTYRGTAYDLPVNHAMFFNEDVSFEADDDEEECTIQMKGEKGKMARIVSVKFSIGNDALAMLADESHTAPSEVTTETEGRTKLNMLPSASYSSAGLHQYRWQRTPYVPPSQEINPTSQTLAPPPDSVDDLDLESYERGRVHTAWINLVQDGCGEWMKIPVIIARGAKEGPVFGITAAVHGNELNGVPGIHRLIGNLNVKKLSGTVVACPCVNMTGFLNYTRYFRDGKDLNRTFPGKSNGDASQVYCHALMSKLIRHMEYHIDLHTASFGRVNSYYIRSDMQDPVVADFTWLCNPQIILHNSGQDGTLRGAATELGIKSITIEVGNPQTFQSRFISWTYAGVRRLLHYLKMYHLSDISVGPPNKESIVLCNGGYWMYTGSGGILEVYPAVNAFIKKGDLIARVKNIFGNITEEIHAPEDGMVVGKSSNPVAFAGDRVLHLGKIHPTGKTLGKAAGENY